MKKYIPLSHQKSIISVLMLVLSKLETKFFFITLKLEVVELMSQNNNVQAGQDPSWGEVGVAYGHLFKIFMSELHTRLAFPPRVYQRSHLN